MEKTYYVIYKTDRKGSFKNMIITDNRDNIKSDIKANGFMLLDIIAHNKLNDYVTKYNMYNHNNIKKNDIADYIAQVLL